MGNSIKIFDTVDELARYFASLLASRIRETPDCQSFSWLLSGGNTPKLIFRYIGSNLRDTINWNKVKIFWSDERCVGPEDEESNFKMAKYNLFDFVPIPSSNIFRVQGEAEPSIEAARYSELFVRHVNMVHGIPHADLLLLGLGEDGHTASIFPDNIDLFNSDKLFEPAEHPDTKQKRITATGKIINHAKLIVILATGESKASMVNQVINHLAGWEQLPVSRVRPPKGNIIWLLDKQAAYKIKSDIKN